MSKTEIRLGSTISFDTERESDIIEFVQDLTSQHKLGRFLAYLLRLACETPETLQYREKVSPILREMETLGITPKRDMMFKKYNEEIIALKTKIDEIYGMTEKLYTLAVANKALGLEDRTKELAAAQFALRNQTAQLEKILGSSSAYYTYQSEKIQKVEDKANENMQFILEVYGDVFSELKDRVSQAQETQKTQETSVQPSQPDTLAILKALENLNLTISSLTVDKLQVQNMEGQSMVVAIPEGAKINTDNNAAVKDSGDNKGESKKDSLTDLDASPFEEEPLEFNDSNMDLLKMLGED